MADLLSGIIEKLEKLKNYGPIEASGTRNSAVGRTLESYFGIPMNSSSLPDFKGIEIKSGVYDKRIRASKPLTLFCKVPDWKLSKLKSLSVFFAKYSYERNNKRQFFATSTFHRPNKHALILNWDKSNLLLHESCALTNTPVLSWNIETLFNKLEKKHKKTIWVFAEKSQKNEKEYFHYNKWHITSKPKFEKFLISLAEGNISIGHCITTNSKGIVHERGPSFRVSFKNMKSLFLENS